MKQSLLLISLFICICGIAQPTISSFSPASGPVGTSVTITGTNFSSTAAANIVFFGGVKATVTAASTTSLTVTVPYGADYQPLSVTTDHLTTYSKLPFGVTFNGAASPVTTASFTASNIELTKPAAVAFADIDGDGKPDMIITNKTDKTISVYRNKSTGGGVSFDTRVDFPLNIIPRFVVTGDVNGDGKLDIISMNINNALQEDASFTVLINQSVTGQVSMTVKNKNITKGTFPGLTMGDFNLDGRPDIAVASMDSSQLVIYSNTSLADSASFNTEKKIALSFAPEYLINADMDGDGKTDLLMSKSGDSALYVLRNTSTAGNFSFATPLHIGNTSVSQHYNPFVLADFNNDGKPDIAAPHIATGMAVILTNTSTTGTITFTGKVNIPVGNKPLMLAAGDLNGDGLPDLIVNNAVSATMSVLLNASNSGSIAFDPKADFPVSATSHTADAIAAIADIDMNGAYDFVGYNPDLTGFMVYQNRMLLTPAPNVSVTSFTPTSGTTGDLISIGGTGFAGTSAVSFGGTPAASFSIVSDSLIKAVIGTGNSGDVRVTTPAGYDSLPNFTFLLPVPQVISVTPYSGAVGTTVTISGNHFSSTPGDNIVFFGAVKATVTAASPTALTVTAPAGATHKPITITRNGLTGYSSKPFIITYANKDSVFSATSFAVKATQDNFSFIHAVATHDIDGDGKPDLLAAETGGNKLSILLNKGNIQFGNRVSYATNKTPQSIITTDIDGDGKPDIIVLNNNFDTAIATLSLYRNMGSGAGSASFSAKQDLVIGANSGTVIAGDINGDGKPDLVIGCSDTVSVFHNTSSIGNFSFAARIDYATRIPAIGNKICLGDLTGDGKPELITSSNNGQFAIFSATSSGIFDLNTHFDFSTVNSPTIPIVSDIDGDGKNDIAAIHITTGQVSVIRNTSSGSTFSFADKITYSTNSLPSMIVAGDINGDGKPELIVGDGKNLDSISVFRNTSTPGNIAFTERKGYPAGHRIPIRGMTIGDLDLDGKSDLLIAESSQGNSVRVWRNRMGEPVILSVTPGAATAGDTLIIRGNNFTGVTSVDFGSIAAASFVIASDSVISAVVGAGGSGFVRVAAQAVADSFPGFVYKSTPRISSISPISGEIGSTVTITGANFSNTAADNIVYFGSVKATVTTANNTTLTAIVPAGAAYQPISVTVNKLIAYSSNPFIVTYQGGNKIFSATSFSGKKDFRSGGFPRDAGIADLDGDGKNDVIVTNQADSNITIFKNESFKTFDSLNAVLKIKTGPGVFLVLPVDLNGDGKLDIVTTNSNSGDQASLSIIRNTSTGSSISFATKVDSIATGLGSTGVSAGDLNGDGKTDLVIGSGNSGFVSVFINTTNNSDTISFAPKKEIKTNGRPEYIVLTDLDGDGKTDMAVTDFSGDRVSVFRNTSIDTISFAAGIDLPVDSNPTYIIAGDVDGDGKADLAVSNYSSGTISILKNTSSSGNISFTDKTSFATSTNPAQLAMADINGDGKTDIGVVSSDFPTTTGTMSVFRNTGNNGMISFERFDYPIQYDVKGMSISDLNNDGRPEMIVANPGVGGISVFRNQIIDAGKISSFTPSSGAKGTVITIKGERFTNILSVSFGGVFASSFTVVSDSLINAVVNTGASGSVRVTTVTGTDSLSGFTFSAPEISLPDSTKSNLGFSAIKGNYSNTQHFLVRGNYLQSGITVTAPVYFQVSRNADTGYVSVLSLSAVNNTVDSAKIYVRFKLDSVAAVTGNISLSATNALTRNIAVSGTVCDSVILVTPSVNSITKDSTICVRDSSIRLAVSGGNYALYKWSTGDTTSAITVKQSGNISVQVGSKAGCFSASSPVIKIIKDSNAVPILALTADTVLISSSALNYRWYFNNNLVAGNSSHKLVAKKIGFYGVETSNDRICWSRSNDFPIILLPSPLVNDSATVKAYPNPATGGVFNVVVTLQRPTNVVARVTVTDAGGAVLLQTNKFIFFGREIKIPITLNTGFKGTAFIKVDINGDVKTQTVILQ